MFNFTEEQFINEKKSGEVFPVILQTNADELTPINIFYSLKGKNKFLLESVSDSGNTGRYSFLGVDPFISVKSSGKEITIVKGKKEERFEGDVLDTVRKLIKVNYKAYGVKFPFSGGAVGYIGYDVIRQYEKLPDNNPDIIKIPETYLMFYKKIICYDHFKHSLSVIYNVFPEDTISYAEVAYELKSISEKIHSGDAKHSLPEALKDKTFKSNFSEEEFCSIVEKAKEYIRNGDIFQVVLSQRLTINTESHSFDVYRRLRSKNPSPYLFYIDYEDFQIVGSSPESLVSVFGSKVTTNPIAGTRKRGKDEKEDEELKQELLQDEKEIAEHMMLVDLGRNDIGKVSEFGTVKLEKFKEVDLYSHVMHIVSEVSGTLKKEYDCFEALKSCLPAGTVSGAPKIRAMEIIDELENLRRGLYAGAVGYFSYDGNMDMCIAIRTIIFKDNNAYLQAGAGIVYDSVPKMEYQETLNKAMALKEVI